MSVINTLTFVNVTPALFRCVWSKHRNELCF